MSQRVFGGSPRINRRLIGVARNATLWGLGLKKSPLTRRSNRKKTPLRLYYWNEKSNFGDMISVDIISSLFGYESTWSPPEHCNIYAAGSVLGWASGYKSYVWGSGLMFENDKVNENLIYCAVRGELTRVRLGKKWQRIPVGDPGLLANIVYPGSKVKTQKIGVAPHFMDQDNQIIKKMAKDDRFMIIDVTASPAEVAENISSCKLVLSSSLHGLIFSDSFGVPNLHIELSDKVAGDGYKFHDYYSSIRKEYKNVDLDKIFNDEYLDEVKMEYRRVKRLRKIQRSLVKSFPY